MNLCYIEKPMVCGKHYRKPKKSLQLTCSSFTRLWTSLTLDWPVKVNGREVENIFREKGNHSKSSVNSIWHSQSDPGSRRDLGDCGQVAQGQKGSHMQTNLSCTAVWKENDCGNESNIGSSVSSSVINTLVQDVLPTNWCRLTMKTQFSNCGIDP